MARTKLNEILDAYVGARGHSASIETDPVKTEWLSLYNGEDADPEFIGTYDECYAYVCGLSAAQVYLRSLWELESIRKS